MSTSLVCSGQQTTLLGTRNPATALSALISTGEAARISGVGERTFWRWSHCGIAPAPIKIGSAVRYRRDELNEWIAAGCPRIGGKGAKR